MFKINKDLTSEAWKGGNSKRFVIVHHTASSNKTTFQGIVNFFKKKDYISIHYVVGRNGEITQLVDENDRAWHAGKSEWKGTKDLNNHSIGIEILSDGKTFTDKQREATQWLCQNIIKRNNIPIDNVLTHANIAPGRKWDVGPNFYVPKWGSWEGFQDSLIPKPKIESNAPKWAKKGISFVHKHKLMNADDPNAKITRAELATVLERFYNLINK